MGAVQQVMDMMDTGLALLSGQAGPPSARDLRAARRAKRQASRSTSDDTSTDDNNQESATLRGEREEGGEGGGAEVTDSPEPRKRHKTTKTEHSEEEETKEDETEQNDQKRENEDKEDKPEFDEPVTEQFLLDRYRDGVRQALHCSDLGACMVGDLLNVSLDYLVWNYENLRTGDFVDGLCLRMGGKWYRAEILKIWRPPLDFCPRGYARTPPGVPNYHYISFLGDVSRHGQDGQDGDRQDAGLQGFGNAAAEEMVRNKKAPLDSIQSAIERYGRNSIAENDKTAPESDDDRILRVIFLRYHVRTPRNAGFRRSRFLRYTEEVTVSAKKPELPLGQDGVAFFRHVLPADQCSCDFHALITKETRPLASHATLPPIHEEMDLIREETGASIMSGETSHNEATVDETHPLPPNREYRGCGRAPSVTRSRHPTLFAYVHWCGWGERWNEIVPLNSVRLKPLSTHSRTMSPFAKGDLLLLCDYSSGNGRDLHPLPLSVSLSISSLASSSASSASSSSSLLPVPELSLAPCNETASSKGNVLICPESLPLAADDERFWRRCRVTELNCEGAGIRVTMRGEEHLSDSPETWSFLYLVTGWNCTHHLQAAAFLPATWTDVRLAEEPNPEAEPGHSSHSSATRLSSPSSSSSSSSSSTSSTSSSSSASGKTTSRIVCCCGKCRAREVKRHI